jgi:hypothetical protein
MTAPFDHEAYLRAALHAAADSVEPRGDGLARIRTRLEHARPRAVVWLTAAWDGLRMRAPAAVQDAWYWLRADLLVAWDRYAPGSAPGRHRTRTQSWLRPLSAMAVVMFIVAAGTYVALDISTAVSPSSTNLHQHGGQPAQPGGHGVVPVSPTRSYLGSASNGPKSYPSPSCPPAASPGPSPSPSCQPKASAQPSTSPSPPSSPSPSATPTDSTSPTGSPSPDPSSS